jgi:hypothetical protein
MALTDAYLARPSARRQLIEGWTPFGPSFATRGLMTGIDRDSYC